MAKPIIVSFGGVQSNFDHEKLDRAKLYGRRQRQVLDPEGQRCEKAELTRDGTLLVRSGMTAQGYFDEAGTWIPNGKLVGLDADGSVMAWGREAPGRRVEVGVAQPVRKLGILGAGFMGAGIAGVATAYYALRDMSSRHGFRICATIREAMTLGTDKLAVDAVLIIGEHGDYPKNDLGQVLYPRYEFFKQCVDVFEKDGRVVPIYNDKHLSYSFEKEGRTAALRQKWRDRLLEATKEEVVDLLKKEIQPRLKEAPFIAFAGKELFEKENRLLKEEGEEPLPLYPLS